MNKLKSFLSNRKWGLEVLTLSLAMLSANYLFQRVGLAPYSQGFFAAPHAIYLFCWFGFDRIYRGVIWFALLILKPEWAGWFRA